MTVCDKAQLSGKYYIGTGLTGVPGGKGCKYRLCLWWMVAIPVETNIGALGNNGVQGSRVHKLACWYEYKIKFTLIMHSTGPCWSY